MGGWWPSFRSTGSCAPRASRPCAGKRAARAARCCGSGAGGGMPGRARRNKRSSKRRRGSSRTALLGSSRQGTRWMTVTPTAAPSGDCGAQCRGRRRPPSTACDARRSCSKIDSCELSFPDPEAPAGRCASHVRHAAYSLMLETPRYRFARPTRSSIIESHLPKERGSRRHRQALEFFETRGRRRSGRCPVSNKEAAEQLPQKALIDVLRFRRQRCCRARLL